ncbi:hypothetical protein, partial [uncultured Duncaniella sp.]|uniref:hypothetical protein n=1 Tax=uncultured Duncaniella sp. TaxID=2768039 RepID=UPI0025B6B868
LCCITPAGGSRPAATLPEGTAVHPPLHSHNNFTPRKKVRYPKIRYPILIITTDPASTIHAGGT